MSTPPIFEPSMVETASPSTHEHELNMSDAEVKEKYRVEREKRLHPHGMDQWEEFLPQAQLGNNESSSMNSNFCDMDNTCRVLIVGAGFGGLLFAVRLIQKGFCTVDEIKIVDQGTDFGGTWHWNQYPGLACDIESLIYLPLLEETGYIPSAKYIGGIEVQEHAVRIAKQWDLVRRTFFRTSVNHLAWNERGTAWYVTMKVPDGCGFVQADFVYLATGILHTPKIPDIPGMEQFMNKKVDMTEVPGTHGADQVNGKAPDTQGEDQLNDKVPDIQDTNPFKGKVIHSGHWDYNFTGGCQAKPDMTELKNKRVGVVGTGATAVQVLPELAKWAKEVVVFQRTAAPVYPRHNERAHSESEFMGPGWQHKRAENFNAFLSNEEPLPEVNLVNDEWTKMPSNSLLIGGPSNLEPGYKEKMIEKDMVHQKAIRGRVSDIVDDPKTAESLTPWYYSWCKRPCFSDDFLETFNKPNVTLVDTKGVGITAVTEKGIMACGVEHELDVIVFCTGYLLATAHDHGKIIITLRNNQTLHEKWTKKGIATLHGVMSSGAPNLFFSGPWQTSTSANYPYMLDQLAIHVAGILSMVNKEAQYQIYCIRGYYRFKIEPYEDDEERWAAEVQYRARGLASGTLCTPSYMNAEGSIDRWPPEEALQAARASIWGTGVKDFVETLGKWREQGIVNRLCVTYRAEDE